MTAAASDPWSVIRIRTREEKANADRFVPQDVGRRRQEDRAYESARPPLLPSEMVRIPENRATWPTARMALIRPPARAHRARRGTEVVGRIRPDLPSTSEEAQSERSAGFGGELKRRPRPWKSQKT